MVGFPILRNTCIIACPIIFWALLLQFTVAVLASMFYINQCSALREVTWLISGRANPALRKSPASFNHDKKNNNTVLFCYRLIFIYGFIIWLIGWLVWIEWESLRSFGFYLYKYTNRMISLERQWQFRSIYRIKREKRSGLQRVLQMPCCDWKIIIINSCCSFVQGLKHALKPAL